MTTTPGQPADALAKAQNAKQQADLAVSLICAFAKEKPGGMCGYLDDACTGAEIASKELESICRILAAHQSTAPSGQGREAQNAARWRYWRKARETNVVVSIFGNGCVNKTIEQAEAEIDAALTSQPSTAPATDKCAKCGLPNGDPCPECSAVPAAAVEAAAWMHKYIKITGGSRYEQAACNEPPSYPDPQDGYRWYGADPLYLSPPGATALRPLSDAVIEQGWRSTFSTGNPYCPCNLQSFTKSVRWAERALKRISASAQAGEGAAE